MSVGIFLGICLAGGLLYKYVAAPADNLAERRTFEAAAARLSGTYSSRSRGNFSAPFHRIDCVLNGVSLVIDHARGERPSDVTFFTRVQARASELRSSDLSISREDVVAHLDKIAGGQDVELGDPAFDSRFLVKAEVPARAIAWLDAELRDVLVALDSWCVRVADGDLDLYRSGFVKDADELVRAARATTLLAGAEDRWRRRWQQTAQALGATTTTTGTTRFETFRAGMRMMVEPDLGGARPRVCLRLELGRVVAERLEIARAPGTSWPMLPGWRVDSSPPAAAERWLRPEACAALVTLDPLVVVMDGKSVRVDLPGAEHSVDALEQAMALVALLASHHTAALYR